MSVQVLALPRFDFADRVDLTLPEGCTVADMIGAALPSLLPQQYARVRVTINDTVLTPGIYSRVRPKAGTVVIIRMQPDGDNLRSVLLIAVTVAAIAVGQLYLGPLLANLAIGGALGGGLFGLAASSGTIGLFSGLTTAALAIGGSLLVNVLVPPRGSGQAQGSDKNLQSIQGLQNNLTLNGAVPQVLGFFRYAPPYACRPSTEIVDNEQFVRAAFLFGHGELDVSDVKLGETPIDSFTDVDYEVLPGADDDDAMSLCNTQILEEALGIQLLHGQDNSRFTASDITAFSFDLLFPQGLVFYDHDGVAITFFIEIDVSYRKVGDVSWTTVPVSTSANSQDPIRQSFTFPVATRGRYEVKWNRASFDFDPTTSKVFARSDLTMLRSHRPEYPLNFEFPVALLDLRIKATDQLNGIVNNLNAVVKSIVLDFDGSTWVSRVSNNPASLFRHVLQGLANAYPVADAGIILSDLEAWHTFCADKGLTYNGVRDQSAALLSVLADIAAAGRATPQIIGGRWTVVVDQPQTQIIGAVSPRNSTNFSGSIEFPVAPDAFRVQFFDEENGYESTERVIPWPDLVGDPLVTEDLSLPGKTNAAEIYIEARRRQYEAIYLRESFTVTQDIEGLVLTRGDLTMVSHDVIERTQVAARIRVISGQLVEIDDVVQMDGGTSYACRIRKADGTIVQMPITAMAGETRVLPLNGDVAGSGIAVGDLLMFGPSTQVVTLCRVKSIDRGDNLSVNLSLIPYLPIIDTLTDAVVPPPWDGRFGEIRTFGPPSIPVISGVGSTPDGKVLVHVVSGGGSIVPVSYTVAHRHTGVGSYVEVNFPAGSGAVAIAGYSAGNTLDLKAKAIGITGADSGYGSVTNYTLHLGLTADTTVYTADTTTHTADSN